MMTNRLSTTDFSDEARKIVLLDRCHNLFIVWNDYAEITFSR